MDFDFSEPVDHVLDRLGLCSKRAFNTFVKTHKVIIFKGKESTLETLQKIQVGSREVFIDSEKDSLFVDDVLIPVPQHLYIILNKPVGVVCSKVSDSHKTVFEFLNSEIKSHPFYKNLHVAGRLDSDSHGLVLITSNGKFSSSLVDPQNHVIKTYEVELQNHVSADKQAEYLYAFKNGINLPAEKKSEAFRTKPAELEFTGTGKTETHCIVRLREGKFRQIRRMFAFLGNEVTDLKRISIGTIVLPEDLSGGQMRIWNP